MACYIHLLNENIFAPYAFSVRLWPGRPVDNPRSSNTNDSKMVLDASLNTHLYKIRMKSKVDQPR